MNSGPDSYRKASYQYRPIDQAQNVANKQRVIDVMHNMITTKSDVFDDALRDCYHSDAKINVTHPINTLHGPEAVGKQVWKPLRHALPDV